MQTRLKGLLEGTEIFPVTAGSSTNHLLDAVGLDEIASAHA